jgi:hypothetical protein
VESIRAERDLLESDSGNDFALTVPTGLPVFMQNTTAAAGRLRKLGLRQEQAREEKGRKQHAREQLEAGETARLGLLFARKVCVCACMCVFV